MLDVHGFSMAMLASGRVFASLFHPWSRHQLFMKSTCCGFTPKDAQHGSRLIDVRQVHFPRLDLRLFDAWKGYPP